MAPRLYTILVADSLVRTRADDEVKSGLPCDSSPQLFACSDIRLPYRALVLLNKPVMWVKIGC